MADDTRTFVVYIITPPNGELEAFQEVFSGDSTVYGALECIRDRIKKATDPEHPRRVPLAIQLLI
jgi:hypothetical protein